MILWEAREDKRMESTMVGNPLQTEKKRRVSSIITGAGVSTCVVWRQNVYWFLSGAFYFLSEIRGAFSLENEGLKSLKRVAKIGNTYDGAREIVYYWNKEGFLRSLRTELRFINYEFIAWIVFTCLRVWYSRVSTERVVGWMVLGFVFCQVWKMM